MAGFLDKKTRVIDMVLTDYGKKQLSKGKLNFKFYAFSDDEVDYDPYISNSGSLSETELTSSKIEQIEETLIREATFGLQDNTNPADLDETNIQNFLFTMPQGQKILPEILISPDVVTGSIRALQQKEQERVITRDQFGNLLDKIGPLDKGFTKSKPTKLTIEAKVQDYFDIESQEGFNVSIYHSESDGLTEIDPKRDIQNNLSYKQDLKLLKDDSADRLEEQEVDKKKKFSIAEKK